MTHADQAARLVIGDRNADYGNPREDFYGVGLVWTGLLSEKLKPGETITPRDVALMMAGYKLRRHAHKAKADNVVDAHGYLFCLQWVESGERPRPLAEELQARVDEDTQTIEDICCGTRLTCPTCGKTMPCCCP